MSGSGSSATSEMERPTILAVVLLGILIGLQVTVSFTRRDTRQAQHLVAPLSQTLLTPEDAWQVPVVRWLGHETVSAPIWFAGLLATGCLLGLVAAFRATGERFGLLLVVAIAGLFTPADVVPVGLMFLAHFAFRHPPRTRRALGTLLPLMVGGVSICVTLEFGLVLGLLAVLLFRGGTGPWGMIGWILLVAGPAFVFPGFLEAALRPVSWLWLPIPHDLLPSLGAVFDFSSKAPPSVIGWLITIVVGCLLLLGSSKPANRHDWATLIVAIALFSLGVMCQRYFVLMAVAGILCILATRRGETPQTFHHAPRLTSTTHFIAFAVVLIGFANLMLRTDFRSPPQVDPAQWRTSGTVLLTNLDQSSDWQTGPTGERFQLVVDDRWDLVADRYRDYQGICHDLKTGRIKSYLREDGTRGGSLIAIQPWNPALLVIPADELRAIRTLSLSPEWNIMGLDGERTILGSPSLPQNRTQMARAARTFLFLEWPVSSFPFELQLTIVASGSEDTIRVANNLRSIRFPYAALRYLRDQDSPNANLAEVYSRLEIAHRMQRHCGQVSRYAQARLTEAMDRIDIASISENDRMQFERSLQGLRDGAGRGTRTELLPELPDGTQTLSQRFLPDPRRSTEDWRSIMTEALSSRSDLSPRDQAELRFSLGCAALEEGDVSATYEMFEAVLSAPSDTPFRPLARLHLRYLAR